MISKSDDYIKIFCNIIKSIQNSPGREQIFKEIVESALEVMQAKACSLFLIKSRADKDGLFYPAAKVGLSENYINIGPARGRDITRDIVMKGGYLAAYDATTDPRLENHEAKKQEGIASLLVVPVIAEKDPIGILAIYTAEHREFSDEEIAFLRCLADQGGIAILKARDEYKIKRGLELLANVAETLNSSLDIKVILHLMTSEITLAFNLLGVTIRLLDEEKKELKLVASYGLSAEYLNKGPMDPKRMECMLQDKIELIDDVGATDMQYKAEMQSEGIVSMLHLPIRVKGTVIGLMGLYTDKKRLLSEDDVTLMRSIAKQCGLAIQNASLYLQLQQEKDNLEEEIWGHKAWF